MINEWARATISRSLEGPAHRLLRRGVTPDVITLAGTAGSTIAALVLFPTGHLFAGALIVWGFVMLDMLDGAVARARGTTSRFGGVLDSVCDRVSDGAIFSGAAWWAGSTGRPVPAALALVCLVTGQVISYTKARAEAAGLRADGGLVERAERLILGLTGLGLTGLGVPWAVEIGLGLLAAGSVVTVVQRVLAVRASARELGDDPDRPTGPAAGPARPTGPTGG